MSDIATVLADDPDGLAALQESCAGDTVTTVQSKAGPVVVLDGRRLHSGRDAQREANRFARELDLGDATVVILLGFGSGYVARAIAARSDAKIIAFEPLLDVLRAGLGHGALPPNLRVITSSKRLGEVLYARLQGSDRGIIVPWAASLRAEPDLFGEGLRAAREAIERASLRHRTARLRSAGWLRHYLRNLPNICTGPGLAHVRGALTGTPAIVVAAGPSLDKNVELLRDIGDRAFIIAVNTAAPALARAGVIPHALCCIESLDISLQLEQLPWLDQVPAFIELTGNPAVWELPFAAKLPVAVDTSACALFTSALEEGFNFSAGFCVANASVAIAHALGCGPIILVGSDLAYTDERVYASGTSFEAMRADFAAGKLTGLEGKRAIEERSKDAQSGNRMPDKLQLRETESWDQCGTVRTAPDFLMFRDWYSHAAPTLEAEGIQAINATEGGAYVPGWRHEPLARVIERHRLAESAEGATVRERFSEIATGAGVPPRAVAKAIRAERGRVRRLLAVADEARALVDFDPDGDLRLTSEDATRLTKLNATVREELHSAPLASEAVFGPIEDVRGRGEVTTFAFYSALADPLRELDEELARLLQTLATDLRRAS